MRLVWRDAHHRSQFAFSLVHIPGNQHTTVVATISSSTNQKCRERLVWDADRKKRFERANDTQFMSSPSMIASKLIVICNLSLWQFRKEQLITISMMRSNFSLALVHIPDYQQITLLLSWQLFQDQICVWDLLEIRTEKGLLRPTAVNSRPRLPQ